MKTIRFSFYFVIVGLLALSAFGCGHKESDSHGHGEESEHAEGHDHDHENEEVSGATFRPGEGVIVSSETQKILGIEIADVAEQKIPNMVRLNIQIFGETHRYFEADMDHAGCDVHGSGFLTNEHALSVEPKQPVTLLASNGESFDGFVLSVNRTLSQGEAEVLIGAKDAATKLKDGDFATAVISTSSDKPSIVIPRSALLQTAEGVFVYVVNKDAFLKTVVSVGNETTEYIEITDGLSLGDKVVTKPVETLWLIELRATKGGGHSH